MKQTIYLNSSELHAIRSVDPRLMSYNVEMTEVTGGTFWKAYTPGQIAGSEPFLFSGGLTDFTAAPELTQYYPPIDLYDERLRERARALGAAWVRVSGTWATKTYYDFDGTTGGRAPEGYASVLTREQWIGVLEFVRAIDGKLLISVSNCAGDHPNGGELDLTQTKKIFDFSHAYGVDIDAAEFMNEPNMLEMSGAPRGYTPADYVRDQDIFNAWVRAHYPSCLLVGPCTVGSFGIGEGTGTPSGGIENLMETCSIDALMDGAKVPLDVFSYHSYNGVSERLASMMPQGHWDAGLAHTDAYLAVAPLNAKSHAPYRDKYVPNGQMWVTESGDAGGGGNTWASTYLDVFRTLNELGSFAQITDGVIFHNTLASSDYGFLKHGTFEPRPNYYAVWLWNRLMGQTVYAAEQGRENLHLYCHSRKDGESGCVYLVINNSLTDAVTARLPDRAEVYSLSADSLRSTRMRLNGKEISGLDDIAPVQAHAQLVLAPATCTFVVL